MRAWVVLLSISHRCCDLSLGFAEVTGSIWNSSIMLVFFWRIDLYLGGVNHLQRYKATDQCTKQTGSYVYLIMLTVQQDPGWIHCFLSYRIFIWAYAWLYTSCIDTAHSHWITDSDLTLCWLLREIQTIYNSHSLWHKRTLGKGANWRVINLLNLFLIKPHSYGVFTYTVIEDNLYDSVFLMDDVTFAQIDSLWEPHTFDRFAFPHNTKIQAFNARFWCRGVSGVDAFCQDWSIDNNYFCPYIFDCSGYQTYGVIKILRNLDSSKMAVVLFLAVHLPERFSLWHSRARLEIVESLIFSSILGG